MRRNLFTSTAAAALAALVAISNAFAQRKAGAASPGPAGFKNRYAHPEKASFWAWQWERMNKGLPKAPAEGWNLPSVRTDPQALQSAATDPSATWIGHATVSAPIQY